MRLLKLTFLILVLPIAELTIAAPLETADVAATGTRDSLVVDGVVEAVRQSDIAAQVPGRVTSVLVHAGDRVKVGQPLARLDERMAEQQALAGRSQAVALTAQLEAARRKYERDQQLAQLGFLSAAALERSESDFKSAQAQTEAQLALVKSSVVQTGLHVLVAPYSGVVSMVDVEVGDMASPGVPLIGIYDPSEMRVVLNIPQTRVATLHGEAATIEIPAATGGHTSIRSTNVTFLPTADPMSQMVQARFALPSKSEGLTPGMFARARLSTAAATHRVSPRYLVPSRAIFRRSELTAVYVLDRAQKPQLRLVRSGRVQGEVTEILSGLEAGEKVVLDPLAALPKL